MNPQKVPSGLIQLRNRPELLVNYGRDRLLGFAVYKLIAIRPGSKRFTPIHHSCRKQKTCEQNKKGKAAVVFYRQKVTSDCVFHYSYLIKNLLKSLLC